MFKQRIMKRHKNKFLRCLLWACGFAANPHARRLVEGYCIVPAEDTGVSFGRVPVIMAPHVVPFSLRPAIGTYRW